MLKITTIATCILAIGATGALAEGNKYNRAAGAMGTEHMQHQQPMNQQGQAILQPQGQFNANMNMRGRGQAHIVDEYGRHYNERGDRIR